MDDVTFDALSRRASLLTLGPAGVAALASPIAASAKKKKKKKGDVNKLCKKQVQPCLDFLTAACAGEPSCLAVLGCCSILGSCNTTQFLTCFVEATED